MTKRIDPKDKKKEGSPCEYCKRPDEIDKITREYIDSKNSDKPQMIYLGELALLLKIDLDTIRDWVHRKIKDETLEHPKFARMIKELELSQELRLQQRLMGRYNPTGAIFLLKTKHKYIETEKKLLAGDKNDPLEIIITEERAIPDVE